MSKKYFMKETGEELEFGDIIELNCSKELEDGRVTIEREIKFSEDTVEVLLDLGIIEVEDSLIDFSDDGKDACEDCPFNNFHWNEFDKRLKELEAMFNSVYGKENGSPKKK